MAYSFRKNTMKCASALFLCILAFEVQGHQRQETFLKAGAEFDQAKVEQAAHLYSSLNPKNPAIWYNLAVCYYTLGRFGKALSCARIVERTACASLMVKAQYLIAQIQEKIGTKPDTFWYKQAMLLRVYVPVLLMQILFLLAFGLLLFLGIFGRASTKQLLFLSVVCTGAGLGCGVQYYVLKPQYAVVLSDTATLYAGPDIQFHRVGTLSRGQEVKVVEETQSWYKISFHELQGWIQKTDLDRII